MSSATPKLLKWSKRHSIIKKIFLYYNIYIRNFKFFFNNSQFGEDKRIIKLFEKNKNGFYVDVGCFHPIRQNNTYLMYRLGWRGVNIDLNPLTIELFRIARPNDINICAAISNKNELKTLYFDHQLSTLNTINKNHTIFLEKSFGIRNIKKKKIQTKKLDYLLNLKKIKNIDFLNIDIEGNELIVLKDLNFNHFNIKVICIEIINYKLFSKKMTTNKEQIFSLLKKNNFKLKFKTNVNYIFVNKNYKFH